MRRLLTLEGAPRTPDELKPKEKPKKAKAAPRPVEDRSAQLRANMQRALNRMDGTLVGIDEPEVEARRRAVADRNANRPGSERIAANLERRREAARARRANAERKPLVSVRDALGFLSTYQGSATITDRSTMTDMVGRLNARGGWASERQFEFGKALALRNRTLLSNVFDLRDLTNERYGVATPQRGNWPHAGEDVVFDAVYNGGDDREAVLAFPMYIINTVGDRRTIVQTMRVPLNVIVAKTGTANAGRPWTVRMPVDWIRQMRGLNADAFASARFMSATST